MKKVLYIEPRNNDKQYHYYTLIGKSLSMQEDVLTTFGTQLRQFDGMLDDFDIIILGYGACSTQTFTWYANLSKINTKTPIVAFLFKLSHYKDEKFKFIKENNIIVFGQHSRIREFEVEHDIKINKTFYPFDSDVFKCLGLNKIYDIGMSGALHGSQHYHKKSFLPSEKNIRERLVNLLQNTYYKKYIKCSDKSYSESKIVDTHEYIKTINQSKIWIATNADFGDLTPRYCEVIGCKTLLFCNELPEPDVYLKDGETCVFFKNDLTDLIEKIDFYLNNPELASKISENAYKLFEEKFSCKNISKIYLNPHTIQ